MYLKNDKNIDLEEIEKVINNKKNKKSFRIFWENIVFEDNDYFYKIPNIVAKTIFYSKENSFKKIEESFEIIKKYFSDYFLIPKTQIIEYKPWSYLIKQKKINWVFLTKKILKENKRVKEQFKKLIEINEKMLKETWYFLDILWTDFIYNPNSIHNLMVFHDHILIFDFWLLRLNSKRKIFKFVSRVSYKIQIKIIKKFFL